MPTARPCRAPNRAAVLMPSCHPCCPAVPASVVTTPVGVTLRMMKFPVSATKRFPGPLFPVTASKARPAGLLKEAEVLVPSAEPEEPQLPANTVRVAAV